MASLVSSLSESLLRLLNNFTPGPRTTPKLLHVAIVSFVFPTIFVVSFLTSLGFYRAYVPQARWRERLYLQYGVADNPFAEISIPPTLVASDQPYDVFVHLVLPASEANHCLGNFMCNVTFTTRSGGSLSSSRPAIALPARKFFPFWILSGRHDLTIQLMESITLSALSKPVVARLELGRRDAWRSLGANKEVQTISAEMSLVAVLRGLRWWMSRYPIASVLLSTCLFFFTGSVVALIAYCAFAPPFSTAPREPPRKQLHNVHEARSPLPLPYEPYGKPARLAMDMASVSGETSVKSEGSVKSEDTDSELGDWSDAALGRADRRLTDESSDTDVSEQARGRLTSRSNSSDSLVTVSAPHSAASVHSSGLRHRDAVAHPTR